MEKFVKYKDLIRTIDSDEEVPYCDENSDEEQEFQPSKQSGKRNNDFSDNFTFFTSNEEYNKDPWNDVMKYVKRKAKYKTDDKIKRLRSEVQKTEETDNNDVKSQHSGSDVELSEDELKHDRIVTKEKKKKKKSKRAEETEKEPIQFENLEVPEQTDFLQMNLSRPLMKAIADMRFVHPTPIQAKTIPIALLGRDICGCAATGTGKTAAYMLPTIERLLYRPTNINAVTRVLVLVPTRELGVQVYQVTKQLCQFTDIQLGLAVGGLDLKTQENVLRKNPDIVIATPGRLIDHLKSTPTFGLDSIEILILDEADRMLDEYFAEQMKEIIKQCSRTRQTMLFSATMNDEVENLATVSLKNPVQLFVDSNKDVAFNLRQEFVRIRSDKLSEREPILAALVCRIFRESCIIFVQTKKQAHRLHILLGLLGLKVAELHGNLTQPQRLDALDKFKNKEVDILVATDVAARGLDISGVKTVINFEMPVHLEHYIHRVGRTARAGRVGVSVSLAGEKERKMVKSIIKRAKYPVKNRVILPEIIEKYRQKVEATEPQIEQILREEEEERLLRKTENQMNKVSNMLANNKEETRPWFQTKQERKKEKEKLDDLKKKQQKSEKENKKNKIKSKKIEPIDGKLAYSIKVQAKLAKKKMKPKKMYAYSDGPDNNSPAKGQPKKKKSFFKDIVDVKNAKKMRYQPKVQHKQKAFGKMKNKKK